MHVELEIEKYSSSHLSKVQIIVVYFLWSIPVRPYLLH
jgi:hypothetical protein